MVNSGVLTKVETRFVHSYAHPLHNNNCTDVLSTALAKHHANGDTSMVTEIVNLCPIM